MQIYTRKVFPIILLSLSLCACHSNRMKNNMQESQHTNNESSPEIFSGNDIPQEKIQLELDNVENKYIYYLNNKATLFGDYLYINSMYTNLVFSDRDENGNYYLWQFPEDLLSGITRTYRHFKYKNQLVCISQIGNGNSEIIIYDSSLAIKNRKELVPFNPQYISGKMLYGHSNSTEHTIISIDLETLEVNNIYSSELEKRPNFIINNNKEMIICEHPERNKTLYFKYDDGSLTPIFETKNSVLVLYDDRGLFYLEEINTDSQWNLMLWNGTDIQMIEEIKTGDMNEWIFSNGLPGNIIIEDDFFVSIHTLTEDPYLLIHSIDSKEIERIALENWLFTEADMARYGETFSGIYYENGQIINYFFSNKAGMLQIQTLDITQ